MRPVGTSLVALYMSASISSGPPLMCRIRHQTRSLSRQFLKGLMVKPLGLLVVEALMLVSSLNVAAQIPGETLASTSTAGSFDQVPFDCVQVAAYFATPYNPTPELEDFGLALNKAMYYASGQPTLPSYAPYPRCVDASNITPSGGWATKNTAPNSTNNVYLFTDCNPWNCPATSGGDGYITAANTPDVYWPRGPIITSVQWSTPGGGAASQFGSPNSGANKSTSGATLIACNYAGGCGPNGYPPFIPQGKLSATSTASCQTAPSKSCSFTFASATDCAWIASNTNFMVTGLVTSSGLPLNGMEFTAGGACNGSNVVTATPAGSPGIISSFSDVGTNIVASWTCDQGSPTGTNQYANCQPVSGPTLAIAWTTTNFLYNGLGTSTITISGTTITASSGTPFTQSMVGGWLISYCGGSYGGSGSCSYNSTGNSSFAQGRILSVTNSGATITVDSSFNAGTDPSPITTAVSYFILLPNTPVLFADGMAGYDATIDSFGKRFTDIAFDCNGILGAVCFLTDLDQERSIFTGIRGTGTNQICNTGSLTGTTLGPNAPAGTFIMDGDGLLVTRGHLWAWGLETPTVCNPGDQGYSNSTSASPSGVASVTGLSMVGQTVTFTANNSFFANEQVILSGFTGGNTGLNTQQVTVFSVSSTGFEAVVANGPYSTGTGSAAPAIFLANTTTNQATYAQVINTYSGVLNSQQDGPTYWAASSSPGKNATGRNPAAGDVYDHLWVNALGTVFGPLHCEYFDHDCVNVQYASSKSLSAYLSFEEVNATNFGPIGAPTANATIEVASGAQNIFINKACSYNGSGRSSGGSYYNVLDHNVNTPYWSFAPSTPNTQSCAPQYNQPQVDGIGFATSGGIMGNTLALVGSTSGVAQLGAAANFASSTITLITYNSTGQVITVDTSSALGLSTGDSLYIYGTTNYNGYWTLTGATNGATGTYTYTHNYGSSQASESSGSAVGWLSVLDLPTTEPTALSVVTAAAASGGSTSLGYATVGGSDTNSLSSCSNSNSVGLWYQDSNGGACVLGGDYDKTGATATITAQTLLASSIPTGYYHVSMYADQTGTCTTVGSGEVTLKVTYADSSGTQTALSTLTFTTSAGAKAQITQDIWAVTGSPITATWTAAACTSPATIPAYDAHATAYRIR